jgi:hypothetical protein
LSALTREQIRTSATIPVGTEQKGTRGNRHKTMTSRSISASVSEATAIVQRKFERARQKLATSIPPPPELADLSEAELADAAVGMQMKT